MAKLYNLRKPQNLLLFGTQEEEEKDAHLWEARFAATPEAKLNKLVEVVQAKIMKRREAQCRR